MKKMTLHNRPAEPLSCRLRGGRSVRHLPFAILTLLVTVGLSMTSSMSIGQDQPEAATQESPPPPDATPGTQESVSASPTSPLLAIPGGRQSSNVVVITIHGDIDGVTTRSVERRLLAAEAAQADAVVFEIDTFGGQARAALEICEIIRESPIPYTVAWIHPKAYSAGTIIGLACDEIIVSPTATLGDCAPIVPGMSIPVAERAKIESPLLSEVVDSARRHGYDEKLVQSFIAVDIELWLVQHKATGDLIFIDRDEFYMLFNEDPPETVRTRAAINKGRVLPSRTGAITQPSENEVIEEAPGMTPEERAADIESQQVLPTARPDLTAADAGAYELIEVVVDNQTLLVVKGEEAIRWGLAKAAVSNDKELATYFGASSVVRYNQNWSESMVQLLTSMYVRIALILVFAIGLIWEMTSPGMGVPGAMAVGALLLLLGAPALTGLAQWWDIALVLAGIGLVAAEVFILPGFGVSGIAGLICLGLGFVGTFVAPDPGGGLLPTSPEAQEGLLRGMSFLLLSVFTLGVTMYFGAKNLDRLPVIGRLILSHDGPTTRTAQSSVLGAMGTSSKTPAGRPGVGSEGKTITPLRPIGRIEVDGHVYDAESDHGVIESDRPVRVRSSDRFRIVVEEIEAHG